MGNRTPVPITVTPEAVAVFWASIDQHSDQFGCWHWLGARSPTGYGRMPAVARHAFAHRFSYTLACGPIPPGLAIDHLCRNRSCVRPEHLEAVTLAENSRRVWAPKWPHATARGTPPESRVTGLTVALTMSDLLVPLRTHKEIAAMTRGERFRYRRQLYIAERLGLRAA